MSLKVITSDEMARIEKRAYDEGYSDLEFMENAALAIAEATADFILENDLEKEITLLVGKGNNGGDALAAGSRLIKMGFSVTAYMLYDLKVCSPLCKLQADKFKAAGGRTTKSLQGVILDGIAGTGFKGKAEGVMAEAIEKANLSEHPILAIDIPSGLNGTTGEVGSVAINAHQTIFLGLPKIGFFIGSGWDHIGELIHADFGMPQKYIAQAKAVALYPFEEEFVPMLPQIKRSRHKYQAGYVLAIAGGVSMEGAAILSSYAALVAGAGIVRLFYPKEIAQGLVDAPFEILKQPMEMKKLLEEMKRAKSILIGPGLGRTPKVTKMLKGLWPHLKLPCVLDADALFFLSENPKIKIPENSVLTPHHQEMKRLIKKEPTIEACQTFVDKKKTTLVLKGGPTIIFTPDALPLIMAHGDPGMASAGTGDVLTGIIAGLLAQGLTPAHAAILGTYLHGSSGELAATEKTSYCLTASDLIDFLPLAYFKLLL